MQKGVGSYIASIYKNQEMEGTADRYAERLNSIYSTKDVDLHIEEVTGEEKTVDVVVDIFNRVNSGGTKLSKGDLALAKICATWPDARSEMKTRLDKWKKVGFHFKLEWLLRCINTILTGEALFSALKDVDAPTFKRGLQQAEQLVDRVLDPIASRLGLDHDRVLGSRYSIPLIVRYLAQRDGQFGDYRERDKFLYWYIQTFLWGRYAGSTESVLNQDLDLIEETDGGLDRLINQLRQNRGDLRVKGNDFVGWGKGARFYPLLYMLTRVHHAQDWNTGVELSNHLLGRLSRLEVHHIFPKSLLYGHGYSKAQVNAIANLTFLTQETNLAVSNRDPAKYLEEFAEKQPGAVESHWIPMDSTLWNVERYLDFLEARRELLAAAASEFLDSLLRGSIPEIPDTAPVLERAEVSVPGGIGDDDEEQVLLNCNIWVTEQGLPEGEFLYDLSDPETKELAAVIDLAWPNGLQEGFSEPVAVLIDEDQETQDTLNRAGFKYFTDVESFQDYVKREILVLEPVRV